MPPACLAAALTAARTPGGVLAGAGDDAVPVVRPVRDDLWDPSVPDKGRLGCRISGEGDRGGISADAPASVTTTRDLVRASHRHFRDFAPEAVAVRIVVTV